MLLIQQFGATNLVPGSNNTYRVILEGGGLDEGTYHLHQAYIPLSFYNVNSYNNTVSIRIAGITYTGNITPGAYNVSTLLPALKSCLDTMATPAGVTFTTSYDSATMKITITSNTGVGFALLNSSALKVLGFSPADTGDAGSHTSDRTVDLMYTNTIRLTIAESERGNLRDAKGHSFNFNIPITANLGGVVVLDPNFTDDFKVKLPRTNILTVSVSDDMGRPLALYSDWYMILKKVS